MKRRILFLLFCFCSATIVFAQTTDRKKPSQWQHLVEGARFCDYFLPMPKGLSGTVEWGAKGVENRYTDNGIEKKDISCWGGNILKDNDGKYHLFVCGWDENSPKGHMSWPESVVYHCISDCLIGPFQLKEKIGKGHNPEAFRLTDGRIVLYTMRKYYISDDFNGPWKEKKFTFKSRDRRIIEGLSNLSFAQREDGSYLMVCRGGGIWISKDGVTPYYQVSDKRVYPPIAGAFEDPVIWRDAIQYHLIVNDWFGRIAYHLRSKDGFNWVTDPGEAYSFGMAVHEDGTKEDWFKYERIKIFQDDSQRAIQANFAVIDTIKWEDHANDKYSSKNISIPLRKDVLMEIINKKRITSKTKSVTLKILAEKGFDPMTDLSLYSLRLGTPKEVNYGTGFSLVKFEQKEQDLLLTFDIFGHKIMADDFVLKLIGKRKNGTIVTGYARLPKVDFQPAILSAQKPFFDKERNKYILKITNFGLKSSKTTFVSIKITCGDKRFEVAKGKVGQLRSYESVKLELTPVMDVIPEKVDVYVISMGDRRETIKN